MNKYTEYRFFVTGRSNGRAIDIVVKARDVRGAIEEAEKELIGFEITGITRNELSGVFVYTK